MSKIKKITKRSAASVFRQGSPATNSTAIVNSLNNLSADVGEILVEFTKVQSILNGLAHGSEDAIIGLSTSFDSTVVGLDGSVMFVERASTSSTPEYIFSRTLNRPLTVKESIIAAYTALKESINSIIIEVPDVVSDYTKEYIGEKAFNSGATSSSTSIDGRLSALTTAVDALEVAATDVDLDPLKLFMGMEDLNTPTYTTHNAITVVSDGDSLEKAVALLDNAISSIPVYTPPVIATGAMIFGNGTNALATDAANLYWDNTAKRLGIRTVSPEAELHVTGMIFMTTGIQSYGGNARGVNAIDLQTSRTNVNQVASAAGSFIGGGRNNRVTATYSGAVGDNNFAQGNSSFVVGEQNETRSARSFAHGWKAVAEYEGAQAQANGCFATPGDAERQTVVMRNTTVNATPTELYIDGSFQRLVLNNNSTYMASIHIVGRSATSQSAGYHITALLERNVGAATTNLIGTSKIVTGEDLGPWDAAVGADTVNGSLSITVTGDINNSVRWVATVELTQVSN
jgi:hypothetical protein